MAKRVQTVELKPGDVVATAKLFDNFVRSADPGAIGTPRTVEDVAIQPADRKVDDDRIVFFADGAKAFCRQGTYWTLREG